MYIGRYTSVVVSKASASILLLLGCGVAAVLVTSCVASSDTAPDAGRLTVYSGRSESLLSPLIARFEESTGIEVNVRYASSGVMVATLLEEGTRSPADVFYSQDPVSIGLVDGLLMPLPQTLTASHPDWAKSASNNWAGVTGRVRNMVYNPMVLESEGLPKTLNDLTAPKWSGRLGWAPSNSSFQTMLAYMMEAWGASKAREWVREMAQNEPTAYPSNTTLVIGVDAGEIDLGLTNHYYALRLIDEMGSDFSATNAYFDAGDAGGIAMTTAVGILSTASNPTNAERFVEYLLSYEGQGYFADETFEVPVLHHDPPVGVPVKDWTAVDPTRLPNLTDVQAMLREEGLLP